MKRFKVHGIEPSGTSGFVLKTVDGKAAWAAPDGLDPEAVRDVLAAALVAGDNIEILVDDEADTVTINVTGITAVLDDLEDVDTTGTATDGDLLVWDGTLGQWVRQAPAPAATPTSLVPLTTVVGGVPEFIWDEDNNLVMTEVPL